VQPIQIDSIGSLLLQVSRELKARGWAFISTSAQGHPYQFTLGLQARHAHPELEVVGLTPDLGQTVLERFVARIAAGERLVAGEFYSGVLRGWDLFVVDNPIDPEGPPLTGGRLRVIWPDARARYPWQPDCDPLCAAQAMLIEPDGLDLHGLEVLFANAGRIV
jgi:Domain of unknown function (DUF4262)